MKYPIDESLDWTDHFVEYGFAVLRGLVSRDYCERAVREIQRLAEDPRPINEYTVDKPGNRANIPYFEDPGRCGIIQRSAVLEEVYDDPNLLAAIDKMFGGPGVFDGVRNINLMLNCYAPEAKAELQSTGHMDAESQPGPILSRGFPVQVALSNTEPFGGNTMVWPGTHKQVQKALIDFPDRTFPDLYSEVNQDTEPVEFVAEAGDVLFMHPILIHEGNPNHCPSRMPRISLFIECYRSTWFTEIDPSKPGLSPYERSMAHNGYYKDTRDNAWFCRKLRIELIEKLESEGHVIDEKWKHYADWSTILSEDCERASA
jgi:hypothetical protein